MCISYLSHCSLLEYSREREPERRPLFAHVEEHEERVLGQRLEIFLLVNLCAILLEHDVHRLVRRGIKLFPPYKMIVCLSVTYDCQSQIVLNMPKILMLSTYINDR